MNPIDNTRKFYNELSPYYHLMFENWATNIEEQGKVIASLFSLLGVEGAILDCSCGIGTQLIALKQLGYDIEGSDISEHEVLRALEEAAKRGLAINIRVDDMRTLRTTQLNHYNTILTIGNSLPHLLSDQEIIETFIAMKERLRPKGMVLVGVRDYAPIIASHTKTIEPLFFQDKHGKRIVHQIWDWQNERIHNVHLYITQQGENEWVVKHFTGTYRAITLEEIKSLMEMAGLINATILYPNTTGFCQPIIKGYN